MKFKNLSRVERNMLTGLFCQFVTILLGFLMPRLYLTYYGSGVNGELNTIKQLFAYLYLLEAGVGTLGLCRTDVILSECIKH